MDHILPLNLVIYRNVLGISKGERGNKPNFRSFIGAWPFRDEIKNSFLESRLQCFVRSFLPGQHQCDITCLKKERKQGLQCTTILTGSKLPVKTPVDGVVYKSKSTKLGLVAPICHLKDMQGGGGDFQEAPSAPCCKRAM